MIHLILLNVIHFFVFTEIKYIYLAYIKIQYISKIM